MSITGPVCTKYGWDTHVTEDGVETVCGHHVDEPIHSVFAAYAGVVTCTFCRSHVEAELENIKKMIDKAETMLDDEALGRG